MCTACAEIICNPERPFPLSVFFSTIYSIAVCIYGVVQVGVHFQAFMSCTQSTLLAAVLTCVGLGIIHLLFGFYSFYRFHKMKEQDHGLCERTSKFLLYDWGMCLYIVVFTFSLVWYGVTIFWSNTSTCTGDIPSQTGVIIAILGYVYLFALIGVALLSLCCEACCKCCQSGPVQTISEIISGPPPVPSRHKKPVTTTVYPSQSYQQTSPVYATQGYPNQQGYPPQGYPPQGYPSQNYPPSQQPYSPIPRY